MAEEWFSNFINWVTSQKTINRVRGYLDNYIIPQFGVYKADQIKASDIQLWVNQSARKAKKSVESGALRTKKGSAKDFGAMVHKLSDIFDYGITNVGLIHSPASSVKIPPKPKSSKKRFMVLHDEELSIWPDYLNSLPNKCYNRRFKVICQTLLSSALRIIELLALEIDDLDFEVNTIKVNKTLMWESANKKFKLKGKSFVKLPPRQLQEIGKLQFLKILGLESFHEEMNTYFEKHNLPNNLWELYVL